MRAWGARIYEDDMALDVRGDFLDQWKGGKPVAEIETAIWAEHFDGDEADDVPKLALACAELETGTLTDDTKAAALEVIESGREYQRWLEDAGKAEAALRSHELTLVKKYLLAYAGKPVKRKSWMELQREDKEEVVEEGELEDVAKLDDADWHDFDGDDMGDDEYAYHGGAHIGCFVFWLLTRDYFQPPESKLDVAKAATKARKGTLNVPRFLVYELDGQLFAGEAKPEVRAFVQAYYEGGRHWYVTDYAEVVLHGRKEYSILPTQAEYEQMASRIDERLADYQRAPYAAEPAVAKAAVRRQWLKAGLYATISIVAFGLAAWCFSLALR